MLKAFVFLAATDWLVSQSISFCHSTAPVAYKRYMNLSKIKSSAVMLCVLELRAALVQIHGKNSVSCPQRRGYLIVRFRHYKKSNVSKQNKMPKMVMFLLEMDCCCSCKGSSARNGIHDIGIISNMEPALQVKNNASLIRYCSRLQ